MYERLLRQSQLGVASRGLNVRSRLGMAFLKRAFEQLQGALELVVFIIDDTKHKKSIGAVRVLLQRVPAISMGLPVTLLSQQLPRRLQRHERSA